ncbi:MAG: hypothetical protein A2586_01905 [Candidatus Harrisonbacteria bacterium RIFOXYD1_FULL_40_9]|uniref:Uncharacterized protein n=1 Tax=Candidatus Harrisonbacteria bacterium RIFOXYD1_FULL_40_9 TaxID=1798412 RepID=A0A1G1ZXB4_9BACT|nr:MAG: hypothetical protein A2586_01905 [Candidatus Harrisonbacteria bacterium RIFOXYD1_FULL_40_9]
MVPGKITARISTMGIKAVTNTQGYGKADPSGTVYTEYLNDTTTSRLRQFIDRAAAALSVSKDKLLIEDQRGQKQLGGSIA